MLEPRRERELRDGGFAGLRRPSTVVGLVAGTGLILLSVVVATRRTVGLDNWARELFRPGGEWGELQMQVDVVVEGLRPAVTAALLAVAAALGAILRRSWWPLVAVALTCGAAVAVTLGLKLLVGRPDTHGDIGTLGGSYPSGHVTILLVAAGCTALLLRKRPGLLSWSLAALAGAVMGWALLVQTAHWLTDVLAGVLIGTGVLAAASRLPFTGAAGSSPAGFRAPVRARRRKPL